MEKGKITFKPLHEGMGFHPFSDGLPYAPESKAKYQNGTGANAAGRPRFVGQTVNSTSKITGRTARQLQTASGVSEMEALVGKVQSRPIQVTQTTQMTQPMRASKVSLESNQDISILRKRAFAYLLDSILHMGFWLITNFAALYLFKFELDVELIRDNLLPFLVFIMASQWIFIAMQEVLFETTLGKSFFGLEFKRNHRSLFLRSVIFFMGVLALGLGLYFRPQDKLGEIQLKAKPGTP